MGLRSWFVTWLEEGLPELEVEEDEIAGLPSVNKHQVRSSQDHFLYVTVGTKIFEIPLMEGTTMLASVDRLGASELALLGHNGVLIPCTPQLKSK